MMRLFKALGMLALLWALLVLGLGLGGCATVMSPTPSSEEVQEP